jgi:hypothetical protein
MVIGNKKDVAPIFKPYGFGGIGFLGYQLANEVS